MNSSSSSSSFHLFQFCDAGIAYGESACGVSSSTSPSKILIKGGTVVNAHGEEKADVYVEDGIIISVKPNIKVLFFSVLYSEPILVCVFELLEFGDDAWLYSIIVDLVVKDCLISNEIWVHLGHTYSINTIVFLLIKKNQWNMIIMIYLRCSRMLLKNLIFFVWSVKNLNICKWYFHDVTKWHKWDQRIFAPPPLYNFLCFVIKNYKNIDPTSTIGFMDTLLPRCWQVGWKQRYQGF